MPGTNDFVTLERASTEHSTIVRADVLNRKEFTVQIEDGNQSAFEIDLNPLGGRNRARRAYLNPLAHVLATSRFGVQEIRARNISHT